MKNKWKGICPDEETGEPMYLMACINQEKVYLEIQDNGTCDVVEGKFLTTLKNCKTVTSAKRWVTMNIG